MKSLTVLALLAVFLVAADKPNDSGGGAREKLQGTWKFVQGTQGDIDKAEDMKLIQLIIDGDKFTTKVDATWNELQTGTDQVRFFKLDGDKLSLRTPEIVSAVYAGQKIVGTLTRASRW